MDRPILEDREYAKYTCKYIWVPENLVITKSAKIVKTQEVSSKMII